LALFTNATLIMSNYEWLKKCNIRRFNISLDGLEKEHDMLRGKGNFNRSIDAIKKLKEDGNRVVINCVINSLNIHDLINILHFFVENKLEFQFSLMTPIGRGKDNIDIVPQKEVYMDAVRELQAEYEKLKIAGFIHNAYTGEDIQIDEDGDSSVSNDEWMCNAGTTKFDIDVNGDVYCCPFSKSSLLGNINECSVKELWSSKNRSDFINFTKKYNGRFCKPIGDTMNEEGK
jgi:MoaA/NifB/PqqE/SkfB family radical SAM enzyme